MQKTRRKERKSLIKAVTARENGKKGGKPSKDDYINVDKMCRLLEVGSTVQQISIALDISPSTILRYKKRTRFRRAIEESERIAVSKVKKALLSRAQGMYYEEVTREPDKIVEYVAETGKKKATKRVKINPNKMVVTKRVRKKIAPDVHAISLWLHNKDKDWKNPASTQINNSVTTVNQVRTDVKPEEFGEEHEQRLAESLRILERRRMRLAETSPERD